MLTWACSPKPAWPSPAQDPDRTVLLLLLLLLLLFLLLIARHMWGQGTAFGRDSSLTSSQVFTVL